MNEMLKKYATLVLKKALNIKPGQALLILSSINAVEFTRVVTETAYDLGSKYVHILWNDDEIERITLSKSPMESLKEYPQWKADAVKSIQEEGAALLYIYANNPDSLKDVEPIRVTEARKAASVATKEASLYRNSGNVRWAVVAVPSPEWAKKVFPNLSEEESVEKLWESICKINRLDKTDPVEAWNKHLNTFKNKLEFLNTNKFCKLYYKSRSIDLAVELPEKHQWIGGGIKDVNGVDFVPNIPTEEVFTLPKKEGVNGWLKSTKPLNYGGKLINNFKLVFEKGKIIDCSAEEGYETLKNLIETDDGSNHLGEVALVPHSSPISQSNLIFYYTLFDENASCHFALGNIYPATYEGGTSMSEEELTEAGLNTSLIHIDFMIGSDDLDIDGETLDGQLIPIFRNGDWAL